MPRASGVYLWDGARGTYTISRQTYSTATDVFSTVSFTSGPLRGVDATYLNRVRQGDAGLDSGGLVFKDGSDRYCAVN